MAQIHVLDGDGQNYRVVAHATTPAGNNAVGNAWSAVLVAAGRNTTIMPTGNGLGQISAAEAASVAAGTTIEWVFTVPIPISGSNANKAAALNASVATLIADGLAQLAAKYNYFGYTNR